MFNKHIWERHAFFQATFNCYKHFNIDEKKMQGGGKKHHAKSILILWTVRDSNP